MVDCRFVYIRVASYLMLILFIPLTVIASESANAGKTLTISGVIEVEAGWESVDDTSGSSVDGSDIALATVELGVGAELSDQVSGEMVFLYEEEPDSQVEVDIAIVNFDNEQYFGIVGRQYVPFGVFVSNFVTDPMLLNLGETQATALLGGTRFGNAELALFVYNGDAEKVGDDDQINDFGASLTISASEAFAFGVSYLSDLADSDAALLQDILLVDENLYTKKVAGWSVYIAGTFAGLELSGEVLAAADQFVDLDADGDGEGDKPLAWNVELAKDVADDVELALRVEGSDEFVEMPELQYGICMTKAISESSSVSVEYLHGEFAKFNAPLDTRDLITVQLGLEF